MKIKITENNHPQIPQTVERSSPRLHSAVFYGLVAAAFTGPVLAEPGQSATPPQAAMQVFIDPQTGERRLPTAEERALMADDQVTAISEPELINRDGMRILHMPASSRMRLRGNLDASGKVTVDHSEGDSHE